jgi:hypothetical protein
VNAATAHAHTKVRGMAVWSMMYAEWPEFVPPLRKILASDKEQAVRDRAQILLNAYRLASYLRPRGLTYRWYANGIPSVL